MSTFDGDFDPSFTIDTMRTGKHRITFTIGRSGGARLELETFDGDIQLRRPGEVEIERPSHDKNKNHNNNDDSFDFHSGARGVADYAAKYARKYAPKFARQYAPKYARQYARAYSRTYSH
jgi:hypothetical protein